MTTTTQTLADFLLRRIAEDEAAANGARASLGEWDCWAAVGSDAIAIRKYEVGAHIARHDPARVLAECEAKRRIVKEHAAPDGAYCRRCRDDDAPIDIGGATRSFTPGFVEWPCPTLRALAAVYADHPDYRDEWRP